jgi:hypothetical protein
MRCCCCGAGVQQGGCQQLLRVWAGCLLQQGLPEAGGTHQRSEACNRLHCQHLLKLILFAQSCHCSCLFALSHCTLLMHNTHSWLWVDTLSTWPRHACNAKCNGPLLCWFAAALFCRPHVDQDWPSHKATCKQAQQQRQQQPDAAAATNRGVGDSPHIVADLTATHMNMAAFDQALSGQISIACANELSSKGALRKPNPRQRFERE